MKKEQKEIYAPKEGGSGTEVFKTQKSKFIYYALIVLAVAGVIIAFAI